MISTLPYRQKTQENEEVFNIITPSGKVLIEKKPFLRYGATMKKIGLIFLLLLSRQGFSLSFTACWELLSNMRDFSTTERKIEAEDMIRRLYNTEFTLSTNATLPEVGLGKRTATGLGWFFNRIRAPRQSQIRLSQLSVENSDFIYYDSRKEIEKVLSLLADPRTNETHNEYIRIGLASNGLFILAILAQLHKENFHRAIAGACIGLISFALYIDLYFHEAYVKEVHIENIAKDAMRYLNTDTPYLFHIGLNLKKDVPFDLLIETGPYPKLLIISKK